MYIGNQPADKILGPNDIEDNSISNSKLTNNSVTTSKILDGNVTNVKIADASVTASKIADGNVTDAKLSLVANSSPIKNALNASGDAPIYACRAWVNFNGTGTVAIRGSGNVSSITDNGVGDYTVNFTTAMPDANFCTVFGANRVLGNAGSGGYWHPYNQNSSSTSVATRGVGADTVGAGVDYEACHVSIFR